MKKIAEPSYQMEPEKHSINAVFQEIRHDGMLFEKEECKKAINDEQFFECRFKNIRFTKNLSGCQFVDVEFDHCDFSNCNLSESVFRRVRFHTCRMMGSDFTMCRFQDVSVIHAKADFINLNGTKWKNALWQGNDFTESSISNAECKNLQVSECDFTKTEFYHTPLKDIDVSTSKIDGIAVVPEDLKGLIVNEEQAIACARILGLVIK